MATVPVSTLTQCVDAGRSQQNVNSTAQRLSLTLFLLLILTSEALVDPHVREYAKNHYSS